MRRRTEELLLSIPDALMTYDPPTTNAAEWYTGLDKWEDDRRKWAEANELDPDDLPWAFIGDAPFNPDDV